MTVKKLMEILKNFPQGAIVVVSDGSDGFDEVIDATKFSVVEQRIYSIWDGKFDEPENVREDNREGDIRPAVLIEF